MTDPTCTCRKPRVNAITGDCVLCGLPKLHVQPKIQPVIRDNEEAA